MAVKFPLKMADGAMVRTLEELREHFDIASVLTYYENGRLKKWLENGYYDDEAAQVDTLDAASENFAKELCGILCVDYMQSDMMQQIDLGEVARKNKRIESLKQITVDDKVLAAVDRVAFTQEELTNLIDNHVSEIYLCGDEFIVPEHKTDITYIGVNNPVVRYDGKTMSAGVDFQNVRFDLEPYIGDYVDGRREGEAFFALFEKNLPLGTKLLRAAADNGSAKIQTFLGARYEYGRGMDTNNVEAIRWYRKAAEQGYVEAQYKLGFCYEKGLGIYTNYREAIGWYREAAEQGHVEAQYRLGLCNEEGIWIDRNDEEAVKELREAIQKLEKEIGIEVRYEAASCREGCEFFGNFVDEAVEWYRKAAEQGHAEAQFRLGLYYQEGLGVDEDEEEAVKWYRKAAEQGHAEAQYRLSECYEDGSWDDEEEAGAEPVLDLSSAVSVERVDEDEEEAAILYRKAAEQGDAEAQYRLGECYAEGKGVDYDDEEAVEWYWKAAEQGDAEAQYSLGECYNYGTGVDEDEEEAVKWYRKAAEQGHADAQYELGECYYYGTGVDEDEEEAVKWYRKAAEQGVMSKRNICCAKPITME